MKSPKSFSRFVIWLFLALTLYVIAVIWCSSAKAAEQPQFPESPVCRIVADQVIRVSEARERGITSFQLEQLVATEYSEQAREIERAAIWYVYVSNSDRRLSPKKLSQIVERACIYGEAGIQ